LVQTPLSFRLYPFSFDLSPFFFIPWILFPLKASFEGQNGRFKTKNRPFFDSYSKISLR
jgi:hypothetical protein